MRARVLEETVLPYLDAVFNYARWLTGNDPEAEDIAQDACGRAMRVPLAVRGGDARVRLFRLLRTAWYSRVSRQTGSAETTHWHHGHDGWFDGVVEPEERPSQRHPAAFVRSALEQLPVEFREVIVLREIADLSYREIAAVTGVPISGVMSRLSRGRERLQAMLKRTAWRETLDDLRTRRT